MPAYLAGRTRFENLVRELERNRFAAQLAMPHVYFMATSNGPSPHHVYKY